MINRADGKRENVQHTNGDSGNVGLWTRLPLRLKLVFGMVTVSSTAIVAFGLAVIVYNSMTFKQQMVENLAVQTQMLADNCTGALVFDIGEDAEEVLKSLRSNQEISFACIFGEDDTLFATYRRDDAVTSPWPLALEDEGHRFESERLIMFRPIMLAGREIGMIGIQSELDDLSASLRKSVWSMLSVLAMLLLFTYGLAVALQRVITSPIHQLAETAKSISERHDY